MPHSVSERPAAEEEGCGLRGPRRSTSASEARVSKAVASSGAGSRLSGGAQVWG